jgi:hypothetical protein
MWDRILKMWNSIETLRGVSHGLMWASATLAIAAALATGLKFYVDRRVGELSAAARASQDEIKEQIQREREAAVRSELEETKSRLQDSAAKLAGLETKSQPRSISATQRERLVDGLKTCSAKVVLLTAPLGDPEAIAFAQNLEAVFVAAGWKSDGVSQAVFPGVPTGLIVRVPSKDHIHPCAAQVQYAFASIGIEVPGVIVAGSSVELLDIVVGHKK